MARLLATVLLALCVATPALSQGKTERHPALGLTLWRPTGYEALPVRPRERFLVLCYRAPATEARLSVHVVPHEPGGTERVVDAETFLLEESRAVKLRALPAGRERYGHQPKRWEGFAEDEEGVLEALFVHAWVGESRTVLVEGRCRPEDYGQERRLWERSASTMRLVEPEDLEARRQKLERYYGQRRFRGRDLRVEARLSLVEGWDAVDSEHFIVLHHGIDARFVRTITEHLEAVQHGFEKVCPPERSMDVVSVVRVCRDQDEYLAYGGWEGSVGYWSPPEEELVLFDARGLEVPGLDGEHYTLAVLRHEAFHQYVFHSADQLSPGPWYDEGTAEYFGGAHLVGGRLRGVEPNRYRLARIQEALGQDRAYPWPVVLGLDQDGFYADPALLYAQAWSMVHFLHESKDAQRNSRWRRILPTYFKTLRSAWSIERKRLDGGDPDAVLNAREKAREKALRAAFERVDWGRLEAAWREHVLSLRLPGPEAR